MIDENEELHEVYLVQELEINDYGRDKVDGEIFG